ncbi:hypothetical protein FGG08_004748 [Glutinoglossum americanum]|uniref:Uncharacterized protein n=1 Tax=Glutinoglossum americanum TaxID=1670608 RepID=A0A9P8I6V6_9PEZI|nr:hypothetical protein FGG08_004748 [Glutinoglossum americanum]
MHATRWLLSSNQISSARARSPQSLLPSRNNPPSSPTITPKSNNQAPSSLLTALASSAGHQISSAYNTGEWTKNLPSFTGDGTSPGGGVSLSGSPPAHPSSYGDRGGGVFNNAQPSPPGPAGRVRPLSHPNGYPGLEEHLQQGSGTPYRRSSMYSHHSHKPLYTAQPPLPHLPQAHFYSTPNADLGLLKGWEPGLVPGDSGYYCGFDTLAISKDRGPSDTENVLLMGWQGGLDVFRVERDKLDIIGRLEGLRGGVIGAKVLPWTARDDPFTSLRPLVALAINGPVTPSTRESGGGTPSANSDQPEYACSEHPDTSTPGSTTRASDIDETMAEITHYQTTVEVYSLSKRVHVTTLFSSPPVPISAPMASPQFSPPSEVGALKIDADGKFITVSSGVSGEVFIFTIEMVAPADIQESEGVFSCIGKVWTSVQLNPRRSSSPPGTSDARGQSGDRPTDVMQIGTALLSLNQRWLAVVPPAPSSSPSLNGTPLPSSTKLKAPGISSHGPPPQPPVTCAVDTPEGESVFNRMAREVTQEVIKGAKWVGDQGIRAWGYYWNRPTPGAGQEWSQTRDQPSYAVSQQPRFPPTHAHANQQSQSSGDPTLVSVLDLERLSSARNIPTAAALNLVATFQSPLGCSFLSFAPSGLVLLTVSRKGDVQFVWDLMRMIQGKAIIGPSLPNPGAGNGSDSRQIPYRPHVRQIARFTRLTVANIVDVVWTAPKGDRVAIVTEKRTVHILDLPASALQWPPPRRAAPSSTLPTNSGGTGKVGGPSQAHQHQTIAGGASNAVTAAVQMVNNKAQPIISAARRRRSSGASLGLKITSSGGGGPGGKSMAAGLSKSLGAATGTVSNLRNTGENRLYLPGSSGSAATGCVKWLGGKERGFIGIVCGGILRIHEAGPGHTGKSAEKRRRLAALKPVEFALPALPGDNAAASVVEDALCRLNRGILSGYWISRPSMAAKDANTKTDPHPLSYAEIETNPPYQPFHTDRRINLYVYNTPPYDEWNPPANIHHVSDSSPWVFGQDIDATRLDVGPPVIPGDGISVHEESLVGPMETVLRLGKDDEEVEQVVVTTRRRKKAISGSMGELEDGFFEDDCEVLDFASDRV